MAAKTAKAVKTAETAKPIAKSKQASEEKNKITKTKTTKNTKASDKALHTLKYSEFLDLAAKVTEFKRYDIAKATKIVRQSIKEVLKQKQSFSLGHLGRIKILKVPERKARNPATGEAVIVSARNVVRFQVSDGLKKVVNP